MALTLTYQETTAIRGFLGYLNKHYSKFIMSDDIYLISAVGAWFYQESGGAKRVIGNNPFNIRPGMVSFMANGVRVSRNGNGKFLVFASLTKGFEAAAYLLMHANKAYGYQLALNALKNGGNQAAYDFLAALAMSSWDAAHYGAHDWVTAYNPATNHLLRVYASIRGISLQAPPKPKKPPKKKIPPTLPKPLLYQQATSNYLDPWAARDLYRTRHGRMSVGQKMDGTVLKR